MNKIANQIKQRLSLREPLQESLDIVAELSALLSLDKDGDLEENLRLVNEKYPTCTDFERDFASLGFAIATGVGKTRLMGACITYLHLAHGIRNFFILAPNLTIYNKLIEDFGSPSYEKYVFRGIAEFVHNAPVVITGDNYAQTGGLFDKEEVRINIFNISKFNRDSTASNRGKEKGKAPRIKRISEYLGQSYWSYLSGLEDLVILMDEAHRYRASASQKVLDELKPVLGLEMTATPFDEKGNIFKNVVYEYSLGHALADGRYIKIPAIAKRKGFERTLDMTDAFVDQIMLEDAVSAHQDTIDALKLYSSENEVKEVRPFILVVCRNIEHAKETEAYVSSNAFYEGEYAEKVLRVDSDSRSSEQVEELFLNLDTEDNDIEIVIHVAMLSEGWDVTNLYTIVPLRAANSLKLVEQTIGRGLRLPYGGMRTGTEKVDTLTVMAHDSFSQIIDAAQNPESIWQKMNLVEVEPRKQAEPNRIINVPAAEKADTNRKQAVVDTIKDPQKREKAQINLDGESALRRVINRMNSHSKVKTTEDLYSSDVKKEVLKEVEKDLARNPTLLDGQILKEAKKIYETVVAAWQAQIIEIPRMTNQKIESECWFADFAFDASVFAFKELKDELIRINLENFSTDTIIIRKGISYQKPLSAVLSALLDCPEIDYERDGDLLEELAKQAIDTLENSLEDKSNLAKTTWKYRTAIAAKIYEQMIPHFKVKSKGFEQPDVLPFTEIRAWNFTDFSAFGTKDFKEHIKPVSLVRKYLFNGFQKSGHEIYRFDSNTEKDFACILESDVRVLKWLRPAKFQFNMWYNSNRSMYIPDFVVETEEAIYMVEPKAEGEMKSKAVLQKAEVGIEYCRQATEFNIKNGGKKWEYVLIPHTGISRTSDFRHLVEVHKMTEV